MPAIPRETRSPFGLLMAGRHKLDDFTVDECVADYLAMHPEAVEAEVRAAIEFDTARDRAGTLWERPYESGLYWHQASRKLYRVSS